MGLTTIITATYAKPRHLAEAAESVFAQTRQDWRWWIILDEAIPEVTRVAFAIQWRDSRVTCFQEHFAEQHRFTSVFRPAFLMDAYFWRVTTDYFCWLSDDDLLDPRFLEHLAGTLEDHPDWAIAWGGCKFVRERNGCHEDLRTVHADREYGPGTISPDCRMDGGQILQRRESLAELGSWRLPINWDTASHVDGIYLEKLAQYHVLHPVNEVVLTHRYTELSTNDKEGR